MVRTAATRRTTLLAAAIVVLAALVACVALPGSAAADHATAHAGHAARAEGQTTALAVYDVDAQKARLNLGLSKLDELLFKNKDTIEKYHKDLYANVKRHVARTRTLINKGKFGDAAAQLRAGYGSLASAWKVIASIEDQKAADLNGAVKFLTGSYTLVKPLTDGAITALVVAKVEPLGTLLDFFWTGLTAYTDAVVEGKDPRAAWTKATQEFGKKLAGFACGKAAQGGILEKSLKHPKARAAIAKAKALVPDKWQTQQIRKVLEVFTRPDVREVMGDIFAKVLPTTAFDYIKCKFAKQQHCLEKAHISFTVHAVAELGNGLTSDFLNRFQKPGTGIIVKSKLLEWSAGAKGPIRNVNGKLQDMSKFEASMPSVAFLYTIPWKLFFEPMLKTLN